MNPTRLLAVLLLIFALNDASAQYPSTWYPRGYDVKGDPASWTIGPSCDDCYIGPIVLGFTVEIYGAKYDTVWMNSNGNLTFKNGYNVYTPSPFPNKLATMIAPFYADLDMRGAGIWSYYVDPSNGYGIFTWERARYYYGPTATLHNTFQVIVTNGLRDDLTGVGNNTCFNYGQMQWTTGEASGGSAGFGGVPAFVGINKGDGLDGVEYGTFDDAGYYYDGPGGYTDEVDHLDTLCFCFNAAAGTLPVMLSEFNAGLTTSGTVELNWTTSTETINDRFVIERAGEDLIFEEIGTIKGAGNSIQPIHYQFTDEEPLNGTNYYRLRQVDFDGEEEVHGTLIVEVTSTRSGPQDLTIYPVPAADQTTLTFNSGTDGFVQTYIYDMSGKTILSEQSEVVEGENRIELDLSILDTDGVYILAMEKEGKLVQQRFVKN